MISQASEIDVRSTTRVGRGGLVRRLAAPCLILSLLLFSGTAVAHAGSPAWKVLSVAAPTHIAPKQSEVQRLTVEATGGNFTLSSQTTGEGTPLVYVGRLSFTSGSPVATIDSLAGGGDLAVGDRVTFEGRYEVGVERLVVSCSTDCRTPGSTVTFSEAATESLTEAEVQIFTDELTNVTGAFHVGDEIIGTNGPFDEYFIPGTVVTNVSPGRLTLSRPTTFEYLSLEGPLHLSTPKEETASIAYDASPDAVQTALEALPGFGSGSVKVSGGPGGEAGNPYFIQFGGRFLDSEVGQIEVEGSALVGENAAARTFTVLPGGPGTGELAVGLFNVGGAASSGAITVRVELPPGLRTAGAVRNEGTAAWQCPGEAGETVVTCTSTAVVAAASVGGGLQVPLEVTSTVPGAMAAIVTVAGGGGQTVFDRAAIEVSTEPVKPGIQTFWAEAFDGNGRPLTQAGGHPASAMTAFLLNSVRSKAGKIVPAGDLREVQVDLPPGFLGSPLATPRCPQSLVIGKPVLGEYPRLCDKQMEVGTLAPFLVSPNAGNGNAQSLLNDVPVGGSAAEFTAEFGQPFQSIVGSVRSAEDFGVRIAAPNVATYESVFGSAAVLYGSPSGAHGSAFLVNPTDCAVQREEAARGVGPGTRLRINTWQKPTDFSEAVDSLPLLTGCQALTDAWLGRGPEPSTEVASFEFHPTTLQGSSPTGAVATLHIPQRGLTDPTTLATADLKKAVVTLPRGLDVNPSSANGLEACSEAQAGFLGDGFAEPNRLRFNESPVSCPDGSKLGTFQIKTPLLEEELEGTIYLAAQEDNPFNSLIALYLVVESKRFGVTLKLPGEVRPDPGTGQLTATFDDNPQLPFEELTLHFRGGGGRSTLATPETCGHFETTGSLEPWSAENGEALPIREAGFSIGGSCASSEGSRPFSPSFEAGTVGTQAGAYSPLVIKINRKDGEQELKNIDFTLPKGLTAKLAGVPYCPESAIKDAEAKTGRAEQSSPSCPAASRIGSVDTAAGVGSEPIHVPGSLYLAGPYEGAPLSSVVVTPAVAGPFDLGDVVVRAPLFVDPETAQITARSDAIPTILRGIPLKVRSVSINVDRSDFSLDPTNCESMTVTSSIAGSSGATAAPAGRFQVGGCAKLKFKPKLRISLKGSTKRIGHPALKAVVTYPKKGAYANIARAQVNLPHSEFLDQGNLNKTCTKPVLLEGKCPKKSIYGKAKAWTPLLEKPLQGPVYLVGGYGYKLPALVAELNGQIRVVLKGKVDSGPNKGIRNTFEAVPDAPVERFVLEMKGGKKYGLLENSENLCRKPQRAIARFTAQNGAVDQFKPLLVNQCGKKSSKKHKSHKKR